MADYSKINHLKDLNNSMFNERMNRAYDYGYEDGLARGTECGYKRGYDRGYDRLHKSIYGQTLEEMKEDKGTWEYEPDKPKNTLDDLWKNIKKWEIESHIDTLRNIIKVSDRSDCGIKEIDGTDEDAIMFAINALEQIKAEQDPKSPCDLCRYNPPSSTDGKPCTMCPAAGREG